MHDVTVERDLHFARGVRCLILLLASCTTLTTPGSTHGGDDGKADGDAPAVWAPHPNTSWQIQLSGVLNTSIDASVYDVDLWDTPKPNIDALQAVGRRVICYFSAGSHEDWRPDAAEFPSAAIGNPLDGWPGEHWLDTRDPVVRSIMESRLDRAKSVGCDGVDPDNVDGYTNSPGFPLSADTQLDFNRFLAAEAHGRGLAIGLKNDLDQIPDLVESFEWQINEQCHQYQECDALMPFVAADKPVFNIEYGGMARAAAVCPDANRRDFDTLVKAVALGATPRIACR